MTTTWGEPNPRTNGVGFKVGMNTAFHLDYGREAAFNDLIKQSREGWLQDINGTFDGTVSSQGWVTDPGTAVTRNRVVVIAASSSDMLPLGVYVLTWEGTGDCYLTSTGSMAIGTPASTANRKAYTITDWGSGNLLYLEIPIAATDVTNVVLCHEDYEGTCGPGEADEFRQEFLDTYAEFTGGIRFMNWQASNQQASNSSWAADRTRTEDYRTYTHGPFNGGNLSHTTAGIPLSVCIRLQNKLSIPGWYCIPHEYDDASVAAFGQALADDVDKDLKVGVELSNELWNSGFVQYAYCQAQGLLDVAATRYVTLSGMTNAAFDGNYIQSQFGELGATFDTTASTTHMFRREDGGTFYCLYHSTITGDWEAAEVSTDPDTWVNTEAVTTVSSETVTSVDDTWTEDSTIGPDEDDANVAYTSRYSTVDETYPIWGFAAYRATQCMRIIEPIFDAANRGDTLVRILGVQVGGGESAQSINVPTEEDFGIGVTDYAWSNFDAISPAFYTGNKVLQETQFSNNGADDNNGLQEGATKNTTNMSKSELFDYINQILDTYEADPARVTSYAWWKVYVVDDRGKELIGYEGGHHIVPVGSPEGQPESDAVISWYDDDPLGGDYCRKIIVRTHELGFSGLMYYIHTGVIDPVGGYWSMVPALSVRGDEATYQRLRGFRQAAGLSNNRGI